MKSTLFALKNIASPGRIDIMHRGIVNLEDMSDEELEKLWFAKFPYIQLTEAGMAKYTPEVKPIRTEALKFKSSKFQVSSSKKKN
jgi:hypothetical protein